MLGIGIDTGGTCTDAVIYNLKTKTILATGKTLTTKSNLEVGIANVLDQLPKDLLGQVSSISLSTTLATNACVENKGSRAKLLLIGIPESLIPYLQDIFSSYGMDDLSSLVMLDAKPENLFSHPYDPDWEELRSRAREYFSDCDCVGIVQMNPKANGGRFERTAMEILKKELSIPVTLGYDISSETDILKTCASTMLNARLIPLITEFMEAVHHVMNQRGILAQLSIVRSDGTLMSEETALAYPVETLLCGPAASVLGGCELAGEKNALLVDMGGTTTDIAAVCGGENQMASDGIYMGQWKTMIRGLDVTATALGGDSAVRFKGDQLYLDAERIIPISVLASQYEHVLPSLQKLNLEEKPHTRWIHEFYVLQKDISEKPGYTDYEYRVCAALKEKPLITRDFVKEIDGDLYRLELDRLLAEGVILKSGLTPTDIMVLKGDFDRYDGRAAQETLHHVAFNVPETEQELPDEIYELVEKKLYTHIGEKLLRYRYTQNHSLKDPAVLESILSCCYEQARKAEADRRRSETGDISGCTSAKQKPGERSNIAALQLTTPYALIGVGAPIHVFLPQVARLFGTRAIIPGYAHVANALGAVIGQKTARTEVLIHANYDNGCLLGYTLVVNYKQYLFKDLSQAIALAKEDAQTRLQEKARMQELSSELPVAFQIEEKHLGNNKRGYLMDVIVSAVIKGQS